MKKYLQKNYLTSLWVSRGEIFWGYPVEEPAGRIRIDQGSHRMVERHCSCGYTFSMSKPEKPLRPPIATIISGAELKRWYWLKDELIAQTKVCGVRSTGAKFVILERLMHFLDSGETQWPGDRKAGTRSKFDWHCEALTLQTVLTDSYKNSQNVRRFFKSQLGDGFKFNIGFMEWMKSNIGKTLGDAVEEYRRRGKQESKPGFKTRIKPHNQFNQYTRDFLADNPALGMDDVRRVWALKRALPSEDGRHIYERSDLELKD